MPNKGQSFPPEVFTSDEVSDFFRSFSGSTTGRRNRLILTLALRCQLRCSEVLGLRVADVDTKGQTITVLKGKGGKRRVVGVDGETCRELDAWISTWARNDHGLLFASHKGKRICTSYVRKVAASYRGVTDAGTIKERWTELTRPS